MHRIFGRVHAEFVRSSMNVTAAHAATGEEGGEGRVMMIATCFAVVALSVRSATEFASPDNESVL